MRNADLRFAHAMSQPLLRVNGSTLYQPSYDPVAKPRMLPTAMKAEKKEFARRVRFASRPAHHNEPVRESDWTD